MRAISIILALTAVMVLAAVEPSVGISIEDGDVENKVSRAAPITFQNVSVETGLSGTRGNFFSWGDYDNDGYQDLLIDGKKLFWNTGPPSFRFEDRTLQAGIDAPVNSGVFGDYDNDGWLDIFCGGGRGSNDHPQHPDILWHNERDRTFKKVIPADDVPGDTFPTVASAWSDMDRDGWLDLYMANYEDGSYEGYPDHFWMNNRDGSFRNATVTSKMSEYSHPYQGRGASWCDFDNDGFQDLYVSNYRIMPNYLYRNLGNGTMEEAAAELGVEGHGNLHPVTREGPYFGHSLGSSWGDMDNDGDMDLWVTNLAHKDVYRGPICDDSYLFENLGEEGDFEFQDVREASGIPVKPLGGSVTEGDELMVSSGLADYDNDGDLDLFLPQIYGDVSYASSFLYSNNGDMTFHDVSSQTGVRVWNTYGSAWCDYNNDGWMDLVTGGGTWNSSSSSTENYMVHLYRNMGEAISPERDWLEVVLHGRESNSAAIGSRIIVKVDSDGDGEKDLEMMREVQGGTAAHGQQDSLRQHFGLGNSPQDVDVIVHWSRGRTVSIEDVTPSTILELYEPTDPISLQLNITDISGVDEDPEFTLRLVNNGDFMLDRIDLKVEVEYDDRSDTFIHTVEEIDPMDNFIYVIPFDRPEGDQPRMLSVSVERSFPPVSNDPQDEILISKKENLPPVAVLISQEEAELEEEITIDASGSYDKDGEILSYYFDFGDGTGTGWTSRSIVQHAYLDEGNYTMTLNVEDDRGLVSTAPAYFNISISSGEIAKPVALIISIDPKEAAEGDEIEFSGEGMAYGGRTIREYEWRSDLDGVLSRRESFTADDLSIGEHLISFRVKDSSDAWSEPDYRNLRVTGEVILETWVAISELPGEVLQGNVLIKGTAGPFGEVEYVEIRIDSRPWRTTFGSDEWEYLLDTRELDDDMVHSLQVRAYANNMLSPIESRTFRVNNSKTEGPSSTYYGSEGPTDLETGLIITLMIAVPVLLVFSIAAVFLLSNKHRKRKADRLHEYEGLIAGQEGT